MKKPLIVKKASAPRAKHSPYKMTISRLTVDKLGVKLYDKVSAVVAELVANSYDSDARHVQIRAPMGTWLASKHKKVVGDLGLEVEIIDDGIGMTPDEANSFYLAVGKERRNDPQRGNLSRKFKRKVMGRKGVGKLAPFGVCKKIEVISAGGELVTVKNDEGNTEKGYRIAHFIMEREAIVAETDEPYYPLPGKLDGKLQARTGTTLKLTQFDYRKVPEIADLERQLAQRFGLESTDWQIELRDTTDGGPQSSCMVGAFNVKIREGTDIRFVEQPPAKGKTGKSKFVALGPDSTPLEGVAAGFDHEGQFYGLTGWVAYSHDPYRDDLMAGVRIYCRGKIAAQTRIFNMGAGFTGEHDVRSYLIGVLNADWLDEEEDLIRTDRQDILWSHPLGEAFEAWGEKIVKKIGNMTREPMRKQAWEYFKEKSNIGEQLKLTFPLPSQESIRDNTMEMAKVIVKSARTDELQDQEHVNSLLQLSLLLGPHITLDQKLRQAGEDNEDTLSIVSDILRIAKIAELSSFGRIANDRIRIISRVEELKDDPKTLEAAFQDLIAQAPWLIDPQWSPITSNVSFNTLKEEFEKYYKKEMKKDTKFAKFVETNKRPDFVLHNQDSTIQVIEIKRPSHALENEEMARIDKYAKLLRQFLVEPGNEGFQKLFPHYHITLVCDKLKLTDVYESAFEGLKATKILEHITWRTFLLRTKKMHQDFLNEADRQKKISPKLV